ncbi:MAG: DUF366 family protein [Pseudomonadota bacterium]
MKTQWIEEKFTYDGSQLRSLFAYENYGQRGDSIVSWIGPCDIPEDKIVDMEDVRAGDTIAGSSMLHFIVELFGQTLPATIAFQRLVMASVRDTLGERVVREGDDLFVGEGKLSISIATVSPVSGLVHLALNISNEGTPVQTACLKDLDVDPVELADQVMDLVSGEWEELLLASQKVRWVK